MKPSSLQFCLSSAFSLCKRDVAGSASHFKSLDFLRQLAEHWLNKFAVTCGAVKCLEVGGRGEGGTHLQDSFRGGLGKSSLRHVE